MKNFKPYTFLLILSLAAFSAFGVNNQPASDGNIPTLKLVEKLIVKDENDYPKLDPRTVIYFTQALVNINKASQYPALSNFLLHQLIIVIRNMPFVYQYQFDPYSLLIAVAIGNNSIQRQLQDKTPNLHLAQDIIQFIEQYIPVLKSYADSKNREGATIHQIAQNITDTIYTNFNTQFPQFINIINNTEFKNALLSWVQQVIQHFVNDDNELVNLDTPINRLPSTDQQPVLARNNQQNHNTNSNKEAIKNRIFQRLNQTYHANMLIEDSSLLEEDINEIVTLFQINQNLVQQFVEQWTTEHNNRITQNTTAQQINDEEITQEHFQSTINLKNFIYGFLNDNYRNTPITPEIQQAIQESILEQLRNQNYNANEAMIITHIRAWINNQNLPTPRLPATPQNPCSNVGAAVGISATIAFLIGLFGSSLL